MYVPYQKKVPQENRDNNKHRYKGSGIGDSGIYYCFFYLIEVKNK